MADFYTFMGDHYIVGIFLAALAVSLFVQSLKLVLYHVAVCIQGWPEKKSKPTDPLPSLHDPKGK